MFTVGSKTQFSKIWSFINLFFILRKRRGDANKLALESKVKHLHKNIHRFQKKTFFLTQTFICLSFTENIDSRLN